MNLPLYMITYINKDTFELEEAYFHTTRSARKFLWDNNEKIHDPEIFLFNSMTPITEIDLRD